VAGQLAFIAAGTNGLKVLNVADPQNVELLTTWSSERQGGRVESVFISGNTAWVSSGFFGGEYVISSVLDFSDPKNIQNLGDGPSYIQDMIFVGQHAYITTGGALRVLDISNPIDSLIEGTSDVNDGAARVALAGSVAYVAAGEKGLEIFKVEPANPQVVGTYASGNSVGVAVSGHYAYLASEGPGLEIVDIQDPTKPVRMGAYPADALRVALSGHFAFVAAAQAGLEIIDVSDPARPARVGGFDTPGTAWDVAVSGNLAFVADDAAGLQVIDFSNPASPTRIGGFNSADFSLGLAVAGNLVFLADGMVAGYANGGLAVLDVSTPANPRLLTRYDEIEASDVAVSGQYAYVVGTGYSSNFEVLDVTDPAQPRHVGHSGHAAGASVTVDGTFAYVWDTDASFAVLDITDPSKPHLVGRNSAVQGTNGKFAVAGDHILAACNSGLCILDRFRPFQLTASGDGRTGDYTFRADGPRGLKVRVQQSTDLVHWVDTATITLPSAPISINKANSGKDSARFFRMVGE
jgi:hypothetical protein